MCDRPNILNEYRSIVGFSGNYTHKNLEAFNNACKKAYDELNIWSLSCDAYLKMNYADKNRKMNIEKLSTSEWKGLQEQSIFKGETRLHQYKDLYNDQSFALIILVTIMFKREIYIVCVM